MSSWNFADVWEAIADSTPDRPAIRQDDRLLTWRQFETRSNGLASALLRAGLDHQQTVTLLLYNCPEYLESMFASFKAALVPVNTNYRYGADELTQLWNDTEAAAVIFHSSFTEIVERVRPLVPSVKVWVCVGDSLPGPRWALRYDDLVHPMERVVARWGRSPDDLLLLYTGGTTGRPKGVMWRQDDMFANLNASALFRYPADGDASVVPRRLPDDPPIHLPACPLMHGAGMITSMSALAQGGTIELLASRTFQPRDILDTIERTGTRTVAITGDAIGLPLVEELESAARRWNLNSLIYIVSSGVRWSNDVKNRLAPFVPGVALVDALGSSEGMGAARSVRRSGEAADYGRFRASRNSRVLADDGSDVEPGSGAIGMLVVGGRQPLGYRNDPEGTARVWRVIDGTRYAITGDYATIDADGDIQLVGRGSEVVNTGGEKVFPQEVEEVLRSAPGVVDAAVIGLPHERFGEQVVAVVQTANGEPLDAAVLVARVRASLAAYKAPRRVFFTANLGREPSGKLSYPELRSRVQAGTDVTAAPTVDRS